MVQSVHAKRNAPLSLSQLKLMSDSVGDFIRYWGFRRIHGQLWTQIYLSKEPLSGAELMRNLEVSKALVSPALNELLEYKLIEFTQTDGRTKKYTAQPDVFSVIQKILEDREKQLILTAQKNYELLRASVTAKPEKDLGIDRARLQNLGEMIAAAKFALDVVVRNSESDALSSWSILNDALK